MAILRKKAAVAVALPDAAAGRFARRDSRRERPAVAGDVRARRQKPSRAHAAACDGSGGWFEVCVPWSCSFAHFALRLRASRKVRRQPGTVKPVAPSRAPSVIAAGGSRVPLISRMIVLAAAAHADVRVAVGIGTTFYVWIRLAEPKS